MQKMTLTDVLIRVGYFFASNTSFNTKRPGFVPDRYLLKNRQLLSLRNPEKSHAGSRAQHLWSLPTGY
ncbi:hypothetical protein GFK32_15850 [Salmonella enterica subsp. enterica serovar Enteritidis]|nr:hypothetical protein [Salmonella enterica subsp. enterica serovar Enteritidis]